MCVCVCEREREREMEYKLTLYRLNCANKIAQPNYRSKSR